MNLGQFWEILNYNNVKSAINLLLIQSLLNQFYSMRVQIRYYFKIKHSQL